MAMKIILGGLVGAIIGAVLGGFIYTASDAWLRQTLILTLSFALFGAILGLVQGCKT